VKGFPNQVAELPKIADGIKCLVDIVDAGRNGRDDGVFGEGLVRARVAGTGHKPKPIDQYLAEQRLKSASNQSFRTTARGLRELYRIMNLIDDSAGPVVVTPLGRTAASFSGKKWDEKQTDFWRGVIRDIEHSDEHGNTSHPYQVLLRLVARKPGITRAKCALALEARDDSAKELDRIAALADLSESDIIDKLGVSQSNWDNAKKVLPKFAEQLDDVVRSSGGTFVLADAPGKAETTGAAAAVAPRKEGARNPAAPRAPKSSREVTPETIGKAGTEEKFGDVPLPPPGDPVAMAAAIKSRGERLKRHNLMVKEFAGLFTKAGSKLYEDPFDILALFAEIGVLVEAKTLDGSPADERERVREAIGQLLYYEGFLTAAVAGEAPICKIGCFEEKISDDHSKWLNKYGVAAVWKADGKFAGDELARDFLGKLLPEFK